jgi:Putative Flp pilus-assembly TadE/G-like
LFFSRCAKNQLFKQKDNLSGQIFPFLLICLVALTVALGVTFTAGSGVKTKTCASNAADACSLAAASNWAGAFNSLAGQNQTIHDNFYLTYLPNIQRLSTPGQTYLTEAISSSQNALKFAQNAEKDFKDANDNHNWGSLVTAASDCQKAADAALAAKRNFDAFQIIATYLQNMTNDFKNKQLSSYCNAKISMYNYIKQAKTSGLSYAFNNSCTTSRVSSSIGDNFNFQLESGKFYDPSTNTTNNANFKWVSGTRFDGTPKYCGITAALDSQDIVGYQIKHTLWDYPNKYTNLHVPQPSQLLQDTFHLPVLQTPVDSTDLTAYITQFSWAKTDLAADANDNFCALAALDLRNIMDLINQILANQSVAADAEKGTAATYSQCDSSGLPKCLADGSVSPCCSTNWDALEADVKDRYKYQQDIVQWLTELNSLADGKTLTGNNINASYPDILNKVWTEDQEDYLVDPCQGDAGCGRVGDQTATCACCLDLKSQYQDPNSHVGMMVIDIDNVALIQPDWTTQCTVTIYCEDGYGVPQGTTSTSRSQFDGGVVSTPTNTADYDSRIVVAN